VVDYQEATKIQPGDVIDFKRPGEPEQTAEVTGPVHLFPTRGRVVFAPVSGGMVVNTHILRVHDG
jgi:hypothetical protein